MIAQHQFFLPQPHELSPAQPIKTKRVILLNNGTQQNSSNFMKHDQANQHNTINFFSNNLIADFEASHQKSEFQLAGIGF